MGHPCGYFLGTSFSQICNFNREFKTKSFCGRISIICRSSVAAIFFRTNRSPQSPFLIVEMVYCQTCLDLGIVERRVNIQYDYHHNFCIPFSTKLRLPAISPISVSQKVYSLLDKSYKTNLLSNKNLDYMRFV